jgi:hypothetical protein
MPVVLRIVRAQRQIGKSSLSSPQAFVRTRRALILRDRHRRRRCSPRIEGPAVPSGSLTLRNLPGDYVELACRKGERRGRLSRARLVDQYGIDRPLPDLLAEIAKCERRGNFHDACGVYYVALKPAD